MADFLLVHGAAHGAWCWRDLIPALTALGHKAHAIDLPGHGGDLTPIPQITLDAYCDAILDAIDTPVTLVGHSMAGYPISLAAERAPDKIARLIYLCAYVPKGDLSLAQRRKEAPYQPLLPAIDRAPDGLSFRFNPAMSRELFYHDCLPDIAAYANARLCAQAIAPQETPCPLGANYASVPRAYIRCMDDHTIPPEAQVMMTADWPADEVFEMRVSHSPFFADPDGLARLLDRIVAT